MSSRSLQSPLPITAKEMRETFEQYKGILEDALTAEQIFSKTSRVNQKILNSIHSNRMKELTKQKNQLEQELVDLTAEKTQLEQKLVDSAEQKEKPAQTKVQDQEFTKLTQRKKDLDRKLDNLDCQKKKLYAKFNELKRHEKRLIDKHKQEPLPELADEISKIKPQIDDLIKQNGELEQQYPNLINEKSELIDQLIVQIKAKRAATQEPTSQASNQEQADLARDRDLVEELIKLTTEKSKLLTSELKKEAFRTPQKMPTSASLKLSSKRTHLIDAIKIFNKVAKRMYEHTENRLREVEGDEFSEEDHVSLQGQMQNFSGANAARILSTLQLIKYEIRAFSNLLDTALFQRHANNAKTFKPSSFTRWCYFNLLFTFLTQFLIKDAVLTDLSVTNILGLREPITVNTAKNLEQFQMSADCYIDSIEIQDKEREEAKQQSAPPTQSPQESTLAQSNVVQAVTVVPTATTVTNPDDGDPTSLPDWFKPNSDDRTAILLSPTAKGKLQQIREVFFADDTASAEEFKRVLKQCLPDSQQSSTDATDTNAIYRADLSALIKQLTAELETVMRFVTEKYFFLLANTKDATGEADLAKLESRLQQSFKDIFLATSHLTKLTLLEKSAIDEHCLVATIDVLLWAQQIQKTIKTTSSLDELKTIETKETKAAKAEVTKSLAQLKSSHTFLYKILTKIVEFFAKLTGSAPKPILSEARVAFFANKTSSITNDSSSQPPPVTKPALAALSA